MVTALAIYGLFGAGLAAQGKLYGSAGRKGVYRIKFKTPAAGGINCCGSEKGWARDRRDISHCICRRIGYQWRSTVPSTRALSASAGYTTDS